jgi:hypothetical protein
MEGASLLLCSEQSCKYHFGKYIAKSPAKRTKISSEILGKITENICIHKLGPENLGNIGNMKNSRKNFKISGEIGDICNTSSAGIIF